MLDSPSRLVRSSGIQKKEYTGNIGKIEQFDAVGVLFSNASSSPEEYDVLRKIEVVSIENSEGLVINKEEFHSAYKAYEDNELWTTMEFLKTVSLFGDWSQSRLHRLSKILRRYVYPSSSSSS